MSKRLVVGVNMLWCRPGRVGGSEEYLARQLVGLPAADPEITGRLLVAPGFADAHPELVEPFDVVTARGVTAVRALRIVIESLSVSQHLAGVDLIHHAGGTTPVQTPLQKAGSPPAVLTIHDLQYLRLPQYFSRTRLTYLRLRMPPSATAAEVIAVPSHFVADTVADAFGVDPARVVVVPHGYDPPPAADLPAASDLRRRYGLGTRRMLVYPAMTHPHKGHRLLIDLLAGPWSDPDVVLVLLGGRGVAEKALGEAIAARGIGDRIIRPGRVPARDRDGLIAAADALVFPSEYEGFGAPVLEAMALGTPVICSDQAALPEVVGDAAVVAQPTVDAWADALDAVASDRAGLVERGRRRATQFTTAASGRALAGAYRMAAGGRS